MLPLPGPQSACNTPTENTRTYELAQVHCEGQGRLVDSLTVLGRGGLLIAHREGGNDLLDSRVSSKRLQHLPQLFWRARCPRNQSVHPTDHKGARAGRVPGLLFHKQPLRHAAQSSCTFPASIHLPI